MEYQVMRHIEGRRFEPVLDDITEDIMVLPTAEAAAKVAAKLSKQHGAKFQPRPIRITNDWREREKKRLANGEYKPVIWLNEPWWRELPNHFVHVSVKDTTKVAFTPDAEKGAADKQTIVAPGKYLQKFFGDVLTSEQIRTYTMQHNTTFELNELKFVTTPEEIERVYKPYLGSSCFSGTTKANLYGSGDFAVAYIENTKGEITARTVCVPERKIYVKIYGDYQRLGSLLAKAGYKDTPYDSKAYKGLRLVKKWHWAGFYADWATPVLKPDPKDDSLLVIS